MSGPFIPFLTFRYFSSLADVCSAGAPAYGNSSTDPVTADKAGPPGYGAPAPGYGAPAPGGYPPQQYPPQQGYSQQGTFPGGQWQQQQQQSTYPPPGAYPPQGIARCSLSPTPQPPPPHTLSWQEFALTPLILVFTAIYTHMYTYIYIYR